MVYRSFAGLQKPVLLIDFAFFFFQMGTQMFGWHCLNYMGQVVFGGDPKAEEGSIPYKTYDNGVSHGQLLALIQTIIQVAYSFVNTPIVNKLGLKVSWYVGMICGIISCIFFFFKSSKWVYIVPYIIMALCQVFANSCPYAMVSLICPSETLAGSITSVVFFGNFGTLVAQFLVNMGLGSIGWFKENEGRIIGIPCVFIIFAIICGHFGFDTKGKQDQRSQNESDVDKTSGSDDKPDSL